MKIKRTILIIQGFLIISLLAFLVFFIILSYKPEKENSKTFVTTNEIENNLLALAKQIFLSNIKFDINTKEHSFSYSYNNVSKGDNK